MSSRWNKPETLRDLRRTLSRHRWHFILPCFLIMVVVLGLSQLLPRQYQSSAIFERRNDLVMSEIVGRGAPQSFGLLKRSLIEELRGLPAIDQVIDDLVLVQKPTPQMSQQQKQALKVQRQQMLHNIQSQLRVYFDISENEVDRVRVVFVDNDPQRASKVVNQLVSNYIDNTRQKIDQMLTEASDFFETQSKETRKIIAKLEENRLKFEIENSGMLPSSNGSIQEKLALGEEQLVILERRYQASQSKINRLKLELKETSKADPTSVIKGPNPEFARLKESLVEYTEKLEHALVLEKMTERHPTVIRLRQKIAGIQQQVLDTPREIVTQRVYNASNAKTDSMEMSLMEAVNQRDTINDELLVLQKHVARMRAQTAQFFPVRNEYRKIERVIEDTQRQLTFWEDNHRRIGMALTAEMGQQGINLEFIRPSDPMQRPTSPDPLQIIFAAIALGLAGGGGSVVLADRTDQTLHSLEQANAVIGVPVLGSVAEIMTQQQAEWRILFHRYIQPAIFTGMIILTLGAMYFNYYTLRRPYTPAVSNQQPAVTNENVIKDNQNLVATTTLTSDHR